DVFFKIVVDGATPVEEVGRAADLLSRYFPRAPVFLQPVTPLGTILAVSPALLESFLDQLAVRSLDARVVPQVHKVLKVR
ncbi:MAG: radical SAM protein, partial [Planctomycetota bacterium]|nr:radical SAM protein [Planctomycetota bacterium]